MDVNTLKENCNEFIKEHPSFLNEVNDFFQLALDEIEGGGSLEHECSLAWESINQLLIED